MAKNDGKMVIDISSYVDRYMNDYIVYHPNNFINRGDYQVAASIFNTMYQKAVSNMVEDAKLSQLRAIQSNMKKDVKESAAGLQLLDKIQSGNTLEEILEVIGANINENLEKAYANFDYESIIRNAKKYNSMLEDAKQKSKDARVSDITDLFNLLLIGANEAIKFSPSFLDELTGIGAELSGTENFKLDESWRHKATNPKRISQADLKAANRIIQMLKNATRKFTKNGGTLSQQSFSSTINNIFSTVIGEELSRVMLAKALNEGIDFVEDYFSSLPGFSVSTGSTHKNAFTRGGMRKDTQNRVSKVDIFNSRAFKLSLTVGGETATIEIGSNTSVKWYSSMNERSEIHLVSGTPLGSYFTPGTEEHYAAYNTITHRFQEGYKESKYFHDLYRRLRAATAATFFNDWLSGTGSRIQGSRQYLNKVQFLMVNGKIYSVNNIVRNICNELMTLSPGTESKYMPINLHIPNKVKNEWQTTADITGPDTGLAMIRSRLINEVINKLTISASLNNSVLLKYAY